MSIAVLQDCHGPWGERQEIVSRVFETWWLRTKTISRRDSGSNDDWENTGENVNEPDNLRKSLNEYSTVLGRKKDVKNFSGKQKKSENNVGIFKGEQ